MYNKRLYFWVLTSALAGFLFGFDTVVISGAEQTIQTLWGLNSTLHGLAISMALWGTVIGSLIGGWPTELFGRKKTLEWIGILYFVSAVGSAYAPEVYSFMIARFIGGLGGRDISVSGFEERITRGMDIAKNGSKNEYEFFGVRE